MAQTYHISLQDLEGLEGFPSRVFDLPVNQTFPVGRSSKNTAKPELLPSVRNAFINSPVISREHALLSAVQTVDGPRLYIKDVGSMHGTQVNGNTLARHTPQELATGDILQFGVDVNRNEEFYIARKYLISFSMKAQAQAQSSGFSLGFTVPDSEEEDIAIMTRRGSQINPVTIDDSDQEHEDFNQAQNIRKTELDITVIDDDLVALDGDILSDVQHTEYPESALRTTLGQDGESEGDASSPIHFAGGYLDSDEEAESASSELGLDSPAVEHDALFDGIDGISATELRVEYPSLAPEVSFTPDSVGYDQGEQYSMPPIKELPSVASLLDVRADNAYVAPPPLPPRHISSLEQMWSLHAQAPATMVNAGPSNASHIQTPPPASEFEDSSITPPLPARRTKVSITEIVEEQPPTPTSVNNLKRKAEDMEEEEETSYSFKGYAEAFNQAVDAAVAKDDVARQPGDATIAALADTTKDVIAQRPKKQPRSIVNRLKQCAAYVGYGAVGAVSAFALLANLPDTFFT